MQNEPLNTIAIQQFIQKVKAADNSHAKEVKLDLVSAKNLAYTLGMVMTRLNGNLEKILTSQTKDSNEVIDIKLDGGDNW
jgi:hypothetical protein